MKKILILTVSAGEGHNSVAKAISNKLNNDGDNVVRTVNLFSEYSSQLKYKIVNDGYILSCRYNLNLFNSVFKKLSNANPLNNEKSVIQKAVLKETPKLLKSIYTFKPDVIIATHCAATVILTNLRKVYPIDATIIGILTDYTVHPFWESSKGIDYIITPSEDLELDLLKRGFSAEKIKPFGLPIRGQFNDKIDKMAARKQLNIKENMFTVMVMNGGMFGHTLKILKELEKCKDSFQVIVVNGRDEKSKKEIDKFLSTQKNNKHTVINYGFAENVNVLMSASDILVGKCGCISINESLNIGLPLIGTGRLPYQEIKNIQYLDNNMAAVKASKNINLYKVIDLVTSYPKMLNEIEENIKKIRKPNALNDLANFINELPQVDYSSINNVKSINNEVVIKNIMKKNKEAIKNKKKRKRYLFNLLKKNSNQKNIK